MSVRECWNLDIRQATIRKVAPIEKGTGKIDVDIRVLDNDESVVELFEGEYMQLE